MIVPRAHSVFAQREEFVCQLFLLAYDQPGVTGGAEIFRRIKTERAGKPHGSGHASSIRKRVLGANCLSGIFDHGNTEVLRNSVDAVHVATEPEQMHGNNRTNPSSSFSQYQRTVLSFAFFVEKRFQRG